MAATIEGMFVLIDRASGTMEKMERQAAKTMAAIEGVGAAQDTQSKRASTAQRAVEGNTGALKDMERQSKSSGREVDNLGKSTDSTSRRINVLERALKSLRSELTKLRGHGGSVGPQNSGLATIQKDLKAAKSGISDFIGSFGVLGSALMAFKLPAMGVGLGVLVQTITALGGAAVAVLPGIAALGNGIGAIPNVVGAGIQGMLALKLAFSGVMQAVQAGMQAQNQWAYNQREYQQQLVGANDAVISAHQGLTNAIYAQHQAQLQLTIARREAIRTLQDMEFAANTAVLREARAGLNIQQAKQELQQAMLTPGTSQLQVQSLRLGVMEAVASAQQTHTQATRERQDYSRARRGDPTSQPVMQVASARHAAAQSTIEITNAERALQRSQMALNNLMRQGNAGLAAYRRQLMGLNPIQRQFVKFLVGGIPGGRGSLVKQYQGLMQSAGTGLFPPLEGGVRTLLGAMPMLRQEVHKTGSVIGNLGRSVINTFFGRQGIAQTRSIMDSNVRVMGTGADAIEHAAHMLRQLMVAAEPTVEWLAKLVDQWFRVHDAMMGSQRGQDALRDRFAKFRVELREVLAILHNLHTVFHNVNLAAWDLHQTMMRGAVAGTGNWAKWTGDRHNQKRMHDWFMGLLPVLRAVGKLIAALGKGMVGITSPAANRGTAGLIGGLTKLVPILERLILGLNQAFGPPILAAMQALGNGLTTLVGAGGPLALYLQILTAVVKLLDWLIKLPGVGHALIAFMATAFAVNTMVKYSEKLSGVAKLLGVIRNRWKGVGDEQSKTTRGMASPGTTGRRGIFSRLFGRGGGGAGAGIEADLAQSAALSRQWGLRSMGGPGSETNPLVVMVMGGGIGAGSSANPFSRGSTTGNLLKDAKAGENVVQDLSRTERIGAGLAKVPLLGKLASKLPGGLGRGATIAGDAAKAAGAAGEVATGAGLLGKAGMVAGTAGKFLGPIGLALTALPAVMTLLTAKGNIGQRLQQAGGALVSSATFGLINPTYTTKAGQHAQGAARARARFGSYQVDPITGVLTAGAQASYQHRIDELQGQYNLAAHGRTVQGPRGPMVVGQDAAIRQDRYAQLTTLKTRYGDLQKRAGSTAAGAWSRAFETGIARGDKPQQAMKLLMRGLNGEMKALGPMGRQSLDTNMAAWANEVAKQDPKLKGQMDDLNSYITNSFANMGQNVQIVNGQILTGSTQQWKGIYTALTNPMDKAFEKLNGTFGKIQQKAIGSLMAMGLKRSDAQMLLKNPASANQWMKYANQGAAGGAPAVTPQTGARGRRAGGGRVMGGDPRDVYQFGNNVFGGGELVMNRHHEMDANARLMRHGEPTVGAIVAGRNTPHWAFARGGRASRTSRSAAGYYDPIPGFTLGRTDMGLDANAPVGTPILAIGDSTLTGVRQGWYAGQPLLDFRLTSGPDAGKYWYVAEQISPVTEKIGSQFRAGQVVARYAPSGTGIEIGWAGDASGTTLAQATSGYKEGQVTAAGASFRRFLSGLAHGQIVGGGPLGGGRQIHLPDPQIRGLGGVPQVLAQRATTAYSKNLQGALNAGLATTTAGGFAGVPGHGGTTGQNQALGRAMMLRAGWGPAQWPSLQALWTQESGWNANAVNPSSGAAGIPQALGHGHPFNLGDARGQIAWGLNYIRQRYGSPTAAEAHERAFNWYSGGGRVNWAGWHGDGGAFTTRGPTVFGAGEQPGRDERVTIEPANASSTRPIHIQIDKIEVHRKGDIRKIVDEELGLLAESLNGH